MNTPSSAEQPDYGIDAPSVLATLAIIGLGLLAASPFVPRQIAAGQVAFQLRPMIWTIGAALSIEAVLMLAYSVLFKVTHRERMLNQVQWRGDEQVLDVGTGRGLLAVGAARRLNSGGTATGIDVWSAKDLSGNVPEAVQANAKAEGVRERVRVTTGNAAKMSFADASFDVIVSNLCLHNIKPSSQREQAIREIVRVLKPGGTAVISDYKNIPEYERALKNAGLTTRKERPNLLKTFPPLTILVASKPEHPS